MVALIVMLFCAVEHIGFFVLEAFLWQSDFVKKRFGMSDQKAAHTVELAKNQGVYNLFLAAGIIYTVVCWKNNPDVYAMNGYFFLGCIVVAGLVGAATVTKRIFFIQAVPAIAGIVLLALGI